MSEPVREAKRELRRRLATRRKAVSPADADAAAAECTAHLLAQPALRRAHRVALYAALPDELPTRPLFEALAERGVARLLPRMADNGRLAFARIERWEELRPGLYGILEPAGDAPELRPGRGDVVVVPGVAFDREGWRLGRGNGYYDRTFAEASGPRLVGLAYAFQLVEAVPHESRDRPVDAIVTEHGWLWAAAQEGAHE